MGEIKYADPRTLHAEMPEYYGPPSHKCTICGFLDIPEATYWYELAWFCPECAEKIRKLINRIETEEA